MPTLLKNNNKKNPSEYTGFQIKLVIFFLTKNFLRTMQRWTLQHIVFPVFTLNYLAYVHTSKVKFTMVEAAHYTGTLILLQLAETRCPHEKLPFLAKSAANWGYVTKF